jgi:hypothetical protein
MQINEQNQKPEGHELFGEIISSYSRAQAIEDGVLVDISELAREWFKYPVAVTSRVFRLLNDTHQPDQSLAKRTRDLLVTLRLKIQFSEKAADTVYFAPYFNTKEHSDMRRYNLWSKCGPGDTAEPVITIMFTDED